MLFDIKSIGNFYFTRIEKSMPIFKASFSNLNFCSNNITISQLDFLHFNFWLQDITIPNFTVCYITLDAEYII